GRAGRRAARVKRRFFASTFALTAVLAATAQSPIDHLEFAAAPQLVQCDHHPAFRVTLNAVSATRQPVGVPMTEEQAKANFTIEQGATTAPPFYVKLLDSGDAAPQATYFMLLLDTSGSMNELVSPGRTRFDAAKDAVRRSVAKMNEGVDHIAIVPFDSHQVV